MEKEDYESFKKFVIAKHGKIHGSLGDEAALAFDAWRTAEPHTQMRTNSTRSNPRHQRSVDTTKDIYNEICRRVPPDHLRVTRNIVETAIGFVVSPDPRNYRKYVKMLCDLGYLSNSSIGVYNITERVEKAVQEKMESTNKISETEFISKMTEKYL